MNNSHFYQLWYIRSAQAQSAADRGEVQSGNRFPFRGGGKWECGFGAVGRILYFWLIKIVEMIQSVTKEIFALISCDVGVVAIWFSLNLFIFVGRLAFLGWPKNVLTSNSGRDRIWFHNDGCVFIQFVRLISVCRFDIFLRLIILCNICWDFLSPLSSLSSLFFLSLLTPTSLSLSFFLSLSLSHSASHFDDTSEIWHSNSHGVFNGP